MLLEFCCFSNSCL